MKLFDIDYKKCNDCQKCIRSCAVKALHSNNRQIVLMPNFCIGCGHCMDVCPQHCFTFVSEMDKVKDLIRIGKRVVASVDSVYAGILKCGHGQFVTALKKLGFYQVREAAEAGAYISEEYFKYMQNPDMDNVLTSFCPSFVSLVEKHYPEIIDQVTPIVTPMTAHGRMIKKELGDDTIVVYISPCVSHRNAAQDNSGVDAVLTFLELKDWMIEAGIDIDNIEETPFDNPDPMSNRLYPVSSGVIRAIEHQVGRDKPLQVVRQRISINGVHNAREVLHSIKKGYVHNCFIEFHACAGGCGNGSCIEKTRGFSFKAGVDVDHHTTLGSMPLNGTLTEDDLKTTFVAKKIEQKMPSEEEIADLMKIIGNISGSAPLDCGACGYNTCRAKAIAMYQGKSPKTMCLMYSFEKARSMSNLVMTNTPNIIIIVNDKMEIKEFNAKAEEVFRTSRAEAINRYLYEFIDTAALADVFTTHENVMHIKQNWTERNLTVVLTGVYIGETNSLLIIIEDISEEERARERLLNKKLDTVEMAQNVIDKQMRTAQEIAGLLGETTAETKAILTKLRDSILVDEYSDESEE